MLPAARMTDMTLRPKFYDPAPHVGGPIMPLPNTCIIGGLPAAVMNQPCLCALCGAPPPILAGVPNVMAGGMPLAFLGSMIGNGGTVIMGAATVLVG